MNVALNTTMIHVGGCIKCGVPIYMPEAKYNFAQRDHSENFYCCNGHPQVFVGKTEAQKLREELDREKSRRATAEMDARTARHAESIAKGKLKATNERVKNGVCPCCNRTFQNLMRHMATKHPEFKPEA